MKILDTVPIETLKIKLPLHFRTSEGKRLFKLLFLPSVIFRAIVLKQ